jgi:predicted phage-related endonuclease
MTVEEYDARTLARARELTELHTTEDMLRSASAPISTASPRSPSLSWSGGSSGSRRAAVAELVCAATDPRWLAERRKGVTATDITAILGLSPYQSPFGLWWEKTGPDMPAHEDSDRLRLGRELEPYIRTRWAESCDEALFGTREGLFRNSDRPWQLATPDAVLYEDVFNPELGELGDFEPQLAAVAEYKSWADADKSSWQDGPPPRVRAQNLWQMDTLDVGTGHVGVVFLPSGEFRSYVIKHEHGGYEDMEEAHALCEVCLDIRAMREAGWEFYQRMTGELPPPDVDGSAATLAALRARFADPRKDKSAPVDAELWDAWICGKEGIKAEEARIRVFEAEIREQLGEATLIEVDRQIVGRRIISIASVKAHTRTQDYLKIINREGNGDDE